MFGLDSDQSVRLLYLTILLVLLVGSIGLRTRGAAKFRHLGVWILIAIGLVVAYAYRGQVLEFAAPVLGELTPSRAVEVTGTDGQQQLLIRRSNDGHFRVDAEANGADIRFLVDTGATATVLTVDDAERAGIDVGALAFNRPVQTANGMAYYASATLDDLTIGAHRLGSIAVGVMPEGAMNVSLLGMSTINRFSGWRVEGDQMVLVP